MDHRAISGVGISPTALTRDAISSRHDRALAMLLARTSHSWKMALDRAEVISGRPAGPGGNINVFLAHGEGGVAVDLDGTSLIDFSMGDGSLVLGHEHPAVREVVNRQLSTGWQLESPNQTQLDVARLVQAAGPANERVAFCATGSDATLLAMRAARASTGKDRVGIFTGARHGLHYGNIANAQTTSGSAGIPRALADTVRLLPYGHPAAFDRIRLGRNELAAVLVEPVRPCDPHMDAGLWLRDLADVCRKAGVLLIFDEVMTGFRIGFGGAQEVFGVTPDIVAYGKAIGGGLPLGAVAGDATLMRCFGRDFSPDGIFARQTFAGNTLAMAAGAAFLNYAHANRATLYPALAQMTSRLSTGFHAAAAKLGVPAELRHAGSIFRIVLGSQHSRDAESTAYLAAADAFAVMTLNSGILLSSELCGYVSAAHTAEHIDRAVQVFATALEDLKADGFFARLEHTPSGVPRLS